MKNALKGSWNQSIQTITGYSYICGHCGANAGPSSRYKAEYYEGGSSRVSGSVFICPQCNQPTFQTVDKKVQIPGPLFGEEVNFLPEDIQQLYEEARKCISVNAFTSAVLSSRKLLMNVSVSKGADPGKSFAFYVTYLEDNHFIPPNSRDWVDHIRKKGNEATHEIPSIDKDDAIELLGFTELLLRFVYEMPGRMNKYKTE